MRGFYPEFYLRSVQTWANILYWHTWLQDGCPDEAVRELLRAGR